MDQPSTTAPGESAAQPADSSAIFPGKSLHKAIHKGSSATTPEMLARIIQQAVRNWQDDGNPVQIANTSRGLVILLPSLYMADDGNFTLVQKGE